MKFRVRGTDRRTGRDVVREYEAKAIESAAAFANLDGIEVAEIKPADEALGVSPPPSATVAVEPLSYRTPTDGSPRAPTYVGLNVAGVALRLYAAICYTLAAALVIYSGAGLAGACSSPAQLAAGPTGIFSFVMSLMPALVLFFAAAVTHGLSAACVALRDIARNSWR